jgi:membrane-bound lytic murein transglycosylase A
LPIFKDDLNGDGLKEAIDLQIKKMKRENLSKKVHLGKMTVSRKKILKTLEYFSEILERKGLSSLSEEISKHFLVFQASGLNQRGDVLFTGYYQPVLDARKKPEGEYKYPIYKTPPDLQVLDLGEINPEYAGEKIGLRVEEGIIKPYFDRKAIDEDMVLAGRGLELVYLKDFLDRYFLHIQGSGVMNLENGQIVKVRFASSNYFPYVSIGKLLIEAGRIPKRKLSLEAIRRYYQENPEEIKKYLNRNPRYIFFEEFTGNVTGSEGVELTPGRSIATDKSIFPGGGLAYIICQRPVRNAKGEIIYWTPISRFMIDQDTGSAIKGPGRVDIFWGTGKEAEKVAGSFKETGKLYYLLIK